jgi:hypothetical protein
MNTQSPHTFHIPVMGLGFTIDTPVKVAPFGISSVISIIQDHLVEEMREMYCKKLNFEYLPIPSLDVDHRAKRITAYLNVVKKIVDKQTATLKKESFENNNSIDKYFLLLPDESELKNKYQQMLKANGEEKKILQEALRNCIKSGDIDVNIMTKIDNIPTNNDEKFSAIYSDASSAFRGFALSELRSSVVLSAGLNPRLYAYIEEFKDFFPDEQGVLKKKIILKVSDFRSALIQGKYLAKKGIWISEYRIESGLNCGGHAFPTEGYLLGPILEEFKNKKEELVKTILEQCNNTLKEKGKHLLPLNSTVKITAQGGIGTAQEDVFLREYYHLDGTGWGSPFLLVPEATNVDEQTLLALTTAKKEDYYLSHASPLGILFNNFKKSSAEKQRRERIEKGRPGSPCYNKYLAFNTEFGEKPLCMASRKYQYLKLKQLAASNLSAEDLQKAKEEVMEKECLCEGLSSSVQLNNHIDNKHKLTAVAICPGPNLAYFSSIFTLEQMVSHIYGRKNILNAEQRPHVFVNELKMYVDYLKKETQRSIEQLNEKQKKYFTNFKNNLLEGINYYRELLPNIKNESTDFLIRMETEINGMKLQLENMN